MSGPSTYTPKSGFERWLDSRLPLPRPSGANSPRIYYPRQELENLA